MWHTLHKYTPVSTIRVLYFKHHVTGEAWPDASDLTLREQCGGDSEGVKLRIYNEEEKRTFFQPSTFTCREQVNNYT